MKAPFKSLLGLTCAPLLTLVTGCWTSDARDDLTDAGPLSVSQQCDAIAPNQCFITAPIPANGDFLDLSVASPDPATSTTIGSLDPATGLLDPKRPVNRYTCTNLSVASITSSSGSPIFGSSGMWVHSGTEPEVGNYWGIDFQPENPDDLSSPCHLRGTIAGAYSWGLYMNPNDTCLDGSKSGGLVDASAFDGLTITIGGPKPGPTGATIISLFSVGTPEDPAREQKLAFTVPINPTMTTYRFHWNQMNAPCGHHEWFNPARIINMTGEMVMLAGVAYEYDVKFGKIGFFKD